jgi:hypothetical protein
MIEIALAFAAGLPNCSPALLRPDLNPVALLFTP